MIFKLFLVLVIAFLILLCYAFWQMVKERDKEIIELKKQHRESEAAWQRHCKALREQYQTAIFAERNKNRKELKELKKIVVDDRKYYVELDKIHLVYEDDKLVGWYNPSAEEVEVE